MPLPQKPPSTMALMKQALVDFGKGERELFSAIVSARDPAPDGRYRHWDKLKRLTPPPGLTHERWWSAIKMARTAILEPLPLWDKTGITFKFAVPTIAQKLLHNI